MTVLGVDPSSTRTGYAVMKDANTVVDAGFFTPKHRLDAPILRILQMTADLAAVIELAKPSVTVVEITSGKAGRGSRAGAGPHLAVYGMAVGAMYHAAHRCMCGMVCPALENVWTRGVPKRRRQIAIAAQFPEYGEMMGKDTGGDVADAIGLCLWWFNGGRAEPRRTTLRGNGGRTSTNKKRRTRCKTAM